MKTRWPRPGVSSPTRSWALPSRYSQSRLSSSWGTSLAQLQRGSSSVNAFSVRTGKESAPRFLRGALRLASAHEGLDQLVETGDAELVVLAVAFPDRLLLHEEAD